MPDRSTKSSWGVAEVEYRKRLPLLRENVAAPSDVPSHVAFGLGKSRKMLLFAALNCAKWMSLAERRAIS
jgi:hypothetical protein